MCKLLKVSSCWQRERHASLCRRQHLSDLPGANRYLHPPALNVRSEASFHHPELLLLLGHAGLSSSILSAWPMTSGQQMVIASFTFARLQRLLFQMLFA
ncbi:hypothetical protein CDAR_476621 [Caerostris darwini]|uniref:Uncharacterized protein n=1 Tax=Caerostris darwini TaxID=1538125 RepID=A0AAV4V9B4_9ARAC|nr:hypothetical protein CDAR_476621 [Caerostris darwini]